MRNSRRVAAVTALVLFVAAGVLVIFTVRNFPRGLMAAGLLVLAFVAGWESIRRRGIGRLILGVLAVLLLVGSFVTVAVGGILAEVVVLGVVLVLATIAARAAFRIHVHLPPAVAPAHPVVIWNPKSGGGKAAAAHLDVEARARGIEPIQLSPGDDLFQLARDAVDRGADALAAAGGDGTQAIIATVAAELDLPFACIPAGTRNHFALDLGVDRNDVVGALDAFVNGGERRVDLAEVNGRVFVNNVSLGLYADAVQREGYRDAKLHTVLDTVPEFGGAAPSTKRELRFERSGDDPAGEAIVVMVSNNSYRLGNLIGSGTRPRIDDGRLGLAVLESPRAGYRPRLRQWDAPSFEVESDGPVPAGVDGEALMMDPPLRFTIRPGALRVRIAPHHPGASPAAALPDNFVDAIRQLIRIARHG
jgi:diacylglycerol kinase family enzyme